MAAPNRPEDSGKPMGQPGPGLARPSVRADSGRDQRPDGVWANPGASDKRGATTAQVRGDIQAGLTGDKVAGVDPSASPLGTDDEAAGPTFDPAWIAFTRRQERAGRPVSATANAATPELQPDGQMSGHASLATLAALGGVALAAVLSLLLLAAL